MTENEHLLVCLMEESQELAHACAKALRFGLNHKVKESSLSNGQAIMREYDDLRGALELLQDRGQLARPSRRARAALKAKKVKILKLLELAKKLGTVS